MQKTCPALIAAAVIALVCLPFAFWAAKPSAALHFLRNEKVSGATVVSFAFNIDQFDMVIPTRLEKLDGTNWMACPNGLGGFSQGFPVGGSIRLYCNIKPVTGRSRLVARTHKVGLKWWQRVMVRARLRLMGKNNVPINSFPNMVILGTEMVEITSDEFTLP